MELDDELQNETREQKHSLSVCPPTSKLATKIESVELLTRVQVGVVVKGGCSLGQECDAGTHKCLLPCRSHRAAAAKATTACSRNNEIRPVFGVYVREQ